MKDVTHLLAQPTSHQAEIQTRPLKTETKFIRAVALITCLQIDLCQGQVIKEHLNMELLAQLITHQVEHILRTNTSISRAVVHKLKINAKDTLHHHTLEAEYQTHNRQITCHKDSEVE